MLMLLDALSHRYGGPPHQWLTLSPGAFGVAVRSLNVGRGQESKTLEKNAKGVMLTWCLNG